MSQFQKGTGVVVEGTVVEVRNHTLTAGGTLHKFLAILVDTTSIRKRTFNLEGRFRSSKLFLQLTSLSGKEIETNPGGERLVAKGYLTWDHKKDADEKKISADEFRRILDITNASKIIPPTSNMHPNRVGRFEVSEIRLFYAYEPRSHIFDSSGARLQSSCNTT